MPARLRGYAYRPLVSRLAPKLTILLLRFLDLQLNIKKYYFTKKFPSLPPHCLLLRQTVTLPARTKTSTRARGPRSGPLRSARCGAAACRGASGRSRPPPRPPGSSPRVRYGIFPSPPRHLPASIRRVPIPPLFSFHIFSTVSLIGDRDADSFVVVY